MFNNKLNFAEKKIVIKYFIIINIIMLIILSFLGERLDTIKRSDCNYINSRINVPPPTTNERHKLLAKYAKIDTSIYVLSMHDINMKEKTLLPM